MPAALQCAHDLARATCGRIVVRHGQLRFVAHTDPEPDLVLGPCTTKAIPPR